jgi:hypothetical protein
MTRKDKIYSNVENRFVDVLDVDSIYVFNDFPDSDAGAFMVVAVVEKGGYKNFDGKISDGWTFDGLKNLAKMKGSEKEIIKIGTIFVKATYAENENRMWDKMWDDVLKRAAKFAKDVKSVQEKIMAESITIENY